MDTDRQIRRDRKQNRSYHERRGRANGGELLFNGHRVSVWDTAEVLEVDSSDGCLIL